MGEILRCSHGKGGHGDAECFSNHNHAYKPAINQTQRPFKPQLHIASVPRLDFHLTISSARTDSTALTLAPCSAQDDQLSRSDTAYPRLATSPVDHNPDASIYRGRILVPENDLSWLYRSARMRAIRVWRAVYYSGGTLTDVSIDHTTTKIKRPDEQALACARLEVDHAVLCQRAPLILEPLAPTLPKRAADCASGRLDNDQPCSLLAARALAARRQQSHA